MDIALSQRQIKQKVFGVSFAPGKLEFHFGGTNAELYSNPVEFPKVIQLNDNGKVLSGWLLGNAQLYVGASKGPVLDGLNTTISTDSRLTWGPRAQVHKFYKRRIPGSQRVDRKGFEGYYEYPCTERPKVKFSWDNSKVHWEYVG
jgi:hypothetical protein